MELEQILRLVVPIMGAGIWWIVRRIGKVELNKELVEQALHLIVTILIEAENVNDLRTKNTYIETRVNSQLSNRQRAALITHFKTIPNAIEYARRYHQVTA